jgi:hypothetical protein
MPMNKRQMTVGQVATVSVVLWILALASVLLWAHEPWRAGAVLGIGAATFSGLAGLAAVALTEGKKLNAVLLGRVTAFLFRLLLLGAGLALTFLVFHAEPMAFVLTFFPFFFVSTVLEQLLWATGRGEAPAGSPPAEIVR